MVSPQKYPVKFVQREREEDKPTTKYELRLERGWYSDDGKELKGTITVETELIDDKEEAQELFDEWEIAEEGELLYFDEVEEDDEGDIEYIDNVDSKGNMPNPELDSI